MQFIGVVVAVLFVVWVFGGFDKTPSEQSEIDQRRMEIKAEVKAEKDVSRLLKDPDSAKFQNLYVVRNQQGRLIVCGQVNSKNGFGAYTGYQRFMSSGRDLTALAEQSPGFDQVWDQFCR